MAVSEGTKACRLCLVVESKLISIDMQLENSMRSILGQNISYESGLPKYSCDDCAEFLKQFKEFRAKCLIAQTVLYQILKTAGQVTDTEIRKLDRKRLKLDTHITPHLEKETPVEEMTQTKDMVQEMTSTEEILLEDSEVDGYNEHALVKLEPEPLKMNAMKKSESETDEKSNVIIDMFEEESEVLIKSNNPLEEENTAIEKENKKEVILPPEHADLPEGFNIGVPPDLPVFIEDYPPKSGTRPITVEKTQQTSTKSSHINIEDNVLFKLLQNNFESSNLLRFVGKSLDNENARNLLASTITKEILKENKNSPITSNEYNKWIKNIKVVFPEERLTTYYIPPCVTAQGIPHQARGKLVSQLMNIRRKYQKLGVLDSKERKLQVRDMGSQEASLSPRPLPLIINTIQPSDNTEEDLKWLKSSSEPWELVQSKWKATMSKRFRDLRKPVYSIEKYFYDYPALQKPQGYKLLVGDFNDSYPDYANNFYLNFPSVKNKLIELLSRKATKNDTYLNDLIHLAKDTNEDHRNLAAVLSLPELISPSVVALPGQSISSSDPPSAKRKKGTDKRWKPTKAESREAFVTHVHDDSYLNLILNKRHQNITEKGFTPQPYIAMVGANLFTIKSYFIVVNPNIFYDCPNILAAIDSCFKITWALNLEYAPSTYGPWFFLQKGLYKLDRPFDKGSTSVESLMTDCNLTT